MLCESKLRPGEKLASSGVCPKQALSQNSSCWCSSRSSVAISLSPGVHARPDERLQGKQLIVVTIGTLELAAPISRIWSVNLFRFPPPSTADEQISNVYPSTIVLPQTRTLVWLCSEGAQWSLKERHRSIHSRPSCHSGHLSSGRDTDMTLS